MLPIVRGQSFTPRSLAGRLPAPAPATPASLPGGTRMRLETGDALFLGLGLHVGPELRRLRIDLPDLGEQQHKVIGGAETAMIEQLHRALAPHRPETRLQRQHLPHRHRKAARYRQAPLLLGDDVV